MMESTRATGKQLWSLFRLQLWLLYQKLVAAVDVVAGAEGAEDGEGEQGAVLSLFRMNLLWDLSRQDGAQ